MRIQRHGLLALAAIGSLLLGACNSANTTTDAAEATPSNGNSGAVELSLVAFSVPKAANDADRGSFADTRAGCRHDWVESYGASGDQSRAVVAGLKADYVHFSLEGDVTRLVKAGLVADDWNAGPNKGIVIDSVVVIAVRKGNPKTSRAGTTSIKPGIGIVTPNPGSSGSARWNILAAYGHVLADGGTEDDADRRTSRSSSSNAVALPGSGRDATTAFLAGTGDVLISYENEAILARQSARSSTTSSPTRRADREPGAVTVDADPRAADVPRLRAQRRRPDRVRQEGLPPGRRRHRRRRGRGCQRSRRTRSRPRKTLLTIDRRLRRLVGGQRQVLRREDTASSP